MTRISPSLLQIEPADGEQPGVRGRQQVDHPRPARRIAVGRQHAGRLVHCVVRELRPGQRLPIDADLLRGRIDARAQLGDHAAIDLHAAGGDQFLALPPAAQPRRGQDLLQPLRTLRWGGGPLRGERATSVLLATWARHASSIDRPGEGEGERAKSRERRAESGERRAESEGGRVLVLGN